MPERTWHWDNPRFGDALSEMFYGPPDDSWFEGEIKSVRSYEEKGVLTLDFGFIVTMTDGSEFQLTIVQSKKAQDNG